MVKKKKKQFNLKRPPIITMLGHVDHGKTSILDALRGTKVQSDEAGGITQSTRAHSLDYELDDEEYKLTFIDTPGHEAFSNMRSRGAKVTDIAVLVVAVDDGVQPQTKEAIEFAKESELPIIVALNKSDLKGVDKAKIKRELANEGVQVEELGGEVIAVEVSAKEKTGLDKLVESILLVSEVSELEVNEPKDGKADGLVLESTTDKSQGAISLCLIKAGEVEIGDIMCLEKECGRVRAIKGDRMEDKKKAIQSEPVWILGLNEEIPVGEKLKFFDDAKEIREVVKKVKAEKEEEEELEIDEEMLLNLVNKEENDDKQELNIIVKSESQGTLEVVLEEINTLSNDEAKINIISADTGDITEDDIIKAKTSHGIVIGFKSKLANKNAKIARSEKVLVRNYEIIYDLLDEVGEVLESMIEPEEVRVEVARAVIKQVFELSDGSKVAGCEVVRGTVLKGYTCYVERPSMNTEDNIVGEGKITSLKHGKEEVKKATKGTECGIFIEPQVDIEEEDEIVCFKVEKQ